MMMLILNQETEFIILAAYNNRATTDYIRLEIMNVWTNGIHESWI